MRKLIVPFLSVLLLLLLVPSTHAQDPYSTDSDADGVVDAFDACPTQAGPDYNYGCPDGTVPPDRDGDSFPDVVDSCPDLFGTGQFNGCPDTDGDQIDDSYDNCPTEAGFFQNYGCPLSVPRDGDQDTILDIYDRCPFAAGVPERNGCPTDYNDDIDTDGVPDYLDGCINPDLPGSPENAGCANGEAPNADFDAVPDAQDACPAEYGDGPDGCMIDADSDYLPDNSDACPDQQGNSANFGCPDGVNPPDSDGDGSFDLYDRCPFEAGANGYDCPDSDGDSIPDIDDQCPTTAGDPTLGGCVAKTDATLNPNRVTITPATIATIALLDQIVRPVYELDMGNNDLLVALSWDQPLTTYDLTQPTIAPTGVLESRSGQIQMSADGGVLVELVYGDFGQPQLTIWDPVVGVGAFVEVPDFLSISAVAVRADGEVVAIGMGNEPFSMPIDNPMIRLFGRDGSPLGDLSNLPTDPQQLVLSPDGAWVAVGGEDGTFILSLPDGNAIARLDSAPFFLNSDGMAINRDGSLLAVTAEAGAIDVYNTSDFSLRYSVDTLTATRWDMAQTVRFSPDGAFMTSTGGPFVDGPPPADAFSGFTVVDVASGTVVFQQATAFTPTMAAFTSDMRTLVVGNYNLISFYGVQ